MAAAGSPIPRSGGAEEAPRYAQERKWLVAGTANKPHGQVTADVCGYSGLYAVRWRIEAGFSIETFGLSTILGVAGNGSWGSARINRASSWARSVEVHGVPIN